MLESTSDSFADSRPQVGGEYLGKCFSCHGPIYVGEDWTYYDRPRISAYNNYLKNCEDCRGGPIDHEN